MDSGTGRRIAYWRAHRGLTQNELAHLMGQSRRWVQDIEGGQRQTDPRLSVLQRTAAALRIPLERLVSDAPTNAVPHTDLPPPLKALTDALHDLPEGQPQSIDHLRRRVQFHCEAFAATHYTAAARDLPSLLADAHATPGAEGATLLSRAYQLTASLLFKYGDAAQTPAVLAADRALDAASRSGNAVALGAASRRVARGLIHQRRHGAATQYAAASASTLRPELERAGDSGLATLGMLYLVAAIAATGQGRSARAVALTEGLIEQAADVAERASFTEADFTSFGAANVQIHRADALLRLDDAWSALEIAQEITPAMTRPLGRERQARHLVTVAQARSLTRDRPGAVRALLDAERLAPEEVRRPAGARLVAEMMELVPQPGPDLTGLAERCGVRS